MPLQEGLMPLAYIKMMFPNLAIFLHSNVTK